MSVIVDEHGRPFNTDVLTSSRSIEDPTNPLTEPEAWLDMLGGGTSSSGIRVNSSTALTLGAFWRGVNVVSRDVAKIQIVVYKRIKEGKERAPTHPAYKLLRFKVCPEMTTYEFKRTRQAHAMMTGNGYGYIKRFGDGSPNEMWPLSPAVTYPVRANGVLLYVTTVDNEIRKLPYNDVFHVKGLGFDGLQGYSVIDKAAESIGMGLAATKHTSLFFKNGARPTVILEHPEKLGAEEHKRLKTSWDAMHTGLENHHKTVILEENMKANTIGVTARDSQLEQILDWNIRDIANWIGVPANKLGDQTPTSYNSLEQVRQDYLDDALDGWFVTWEQEAWDKLLTEEEKDNDTHVIEFMRQALLRADLKARGEYYSKATGGVPWMLPDEVRARENDPPLPDGEGKVFRVPVGIAEPPDEDEDDDDDDEGGGNGNPAPFPPPADDDDDDEDEERKRVREAHEALLDDRVKFILRRIGRDAERAAKTPDTFCKWLDDELEERHRDAVWDALRPAVGACLAAGGGNPDKRTGEARQAILKTCRDRLDIAAWTTSPATLPSFVAKRVQGEEWGGVYSFPSLVRDIVWSNENAN